MNSATTILHQDLNNVIAYVPRLVGALVIFAIGYVIARLLGRLVTFLLTEGGLNRLGERSGLADTLTAAGLPPRPAELAGKLTFVIVLVAALVQTVDALGLAPLSQALRQLLVFTPHVILAGTVLLAGAVLGDMGGRGVSAAMNRGGVLYHSLVGSLVRGLVLVMALLLALQQLTLDATFLLAVLLVVLGGIALALAIAVGWGGRTMVENLIAARYVEQNFKVGDDLMIEDVAGTVERVGPTSAVLRSAAGGKIVIPNGIFARAVIHPGSATGDAATHGS
jgi:small-conductance mechanosensitive channel